MTKNENIVVSFIKGLIVALILTLGFVVLFAFCIKWFCIEDKYIYGGTLFIKAICTLIGSLVAIKGKIRGLIKGLCFGLAYIFLSFVIFSLLSGAFIIDRQTILDFVFCATLGGIVGIVKVNK